MNRYRAVIHNDTLDEYGVIIEQERSHLGKDFINAALSHGLDEIYHYGKDAKQVSIDFYSNGVLIFTMYLITYECGLDVFTDVYLEENCIRTIKQ